MGFFSKITSSVGDLFGKVDPTGLVSAGLGFVGSQMANQANAKMASNQMDFQERMARNSYQYGMEDMRKAGLNPIFAYSQGGAATPSGATATMQNSLGAGVDAYNATTASALAMKRNKYELELLERQASNLGMDTALKSQNILVGESNEKVNATQADLNKKNAALTEQMLQKAAWDTVRSMHEATNAKTIADLNRKTSELTTRDTEYKLDNPMLMKISEWAGALGRILGGGNSAKQLLTPNH